jgi:DNA repair photolyase
MKIENPRKGRGAVLSPDGRFDAWQREAADDGWWQDDAAAPATELIADTAKTVITYNTSPDIPYDRSINPYRGCEHGCAYCFARPSHAYLGLSRRGSISKPASPTRPMRSTACAAELAKPGYVCRPVALGINTDAWQPVERRLRITRGILEVLAETRHPVTIVTKSALILRDLDLLAGMARDGLAHVAVSITTLDADLARRMEPRAPSPQRRLSVIRAGRRRHTDRGDGGAADPGADRPRNGSHPRRRARCGRESAGYILLRLPHEVKPLFRAWLDATQPGSRRACLQPDAPDARRQGIRQRLRYRQRGSGPLAEIIAQRFAQRAAPSRTRQAFAADECRAFRPPPRPPPAPQMSLF